MDAPIDQVATERSSGTFIVLLVASFLGTQVLSYLDAGFILYWITVLGAALYVFRRPGEGIWVTFFALAITSLLYPISMSELGEPGAGEFRPYNFAIASMAGAMIFNLWLRRRRRLPLILLRRRSGTLKLVLALAGVFCLATICGDLSPMKAEALYVLQQSSAWISFFLFLWIGYKLALSPVEIEQSLERFHSAVLIYSLVFLGKFAYLNYDDGLRAATEFAWTQRMVLFFAGCSLVLIFARRLAPEGRSPTKSGWLSALIVVPAIVLSGSRGLTGAAFLTVFVLVASWRTRTLLRLSPILLVALVAVAFVLRSHSQLVEEYVVSKFLVTPDEDPSFVGRVAEMGAVIEALQRNPVLGSGTLASYMFFDPLFGWRESSFVDSGVGYLLLKTGLLGTGVFVLLVLSYLKVLRQLRQSVAAAALIPMVVFVFYLTFLVFGSAFFDPRYSWLVGILCGYILYLNKIYSEKTSLWVMEIGNQWKSKLS
jgi:O-Antigen ligase